MYQNVTDSNLYDLQDNLISGMNLLREFTKCEGTYSSLLPWTVAWERRIFSSLDAWASNLPAYESDR
jgi:hypothetical protein